KEYYELSSAQKRLYVIYQMDLESIAYNILLITWLVGELDETGFDYAFRKLTRRHENLRTSFKVIEGEAVQTVHDEVEFEIEYYSATEDTENTEGVAPPTYYCSRNTQMPNEKFWNENKVLQHSNTEGTRGLAPLYKEPAASTIKDFIRPFDLFQPPLLRVGLIKMEQNRHILMVDIHHIISDGLSQGILVQEFMKLYCGEELPPLRIQYKDYCQWLNSEKQKERLKNQESYWLKEFASEVPLLHIPVDFKTPAVQGFAGRSITFKIEPEDTKALRGLLREERVTLSTALLAIYYVLLAKYSGQEDIIIGIATAGRTHADLQNTAGMFVNMLPARNRPNENKTFAAFLKEVKENLLNAYENQDYPYEELIKKLKLQRVPGRDPLIDAVFTLQDFDDKKNHDNGLQIGSLKILPYQYEPGNSTFPLDLEPLEEKNTIRLRLRYFAHLFKKSTINTITCHFLEVLKQVLENINIRIKNIKISYQLSSSKRDILQEDDKDFNF
ncbi:MAG: hypothetical protein JSV88_31440, partial [Candidatus Aminicenantes bacterium]